MGVDEEVEKEEVTETKSVDSFFDASSEKAEAHETTEDVAPEEKPEEEVKEEPEKPSSEEKVETEEKVEEEVVSPDWETDDNPYKKRFKDTREWANNQNQERTKLEKAVEILTKKIDGTYVEGEEEVGPSPEEIGADADYHGRLKASTKAVIERYGEKEVHDKLFADDSPFQVLSQDPTIYARVQNSEAPALEAMNVVKEDAFFSKYGHDIDEIESNMIKKLEPEITARLKKELKEKLKLQKEQPKGLTGLNSDAPSSEEKAHVGKSIEDYFG